MQVHQLRGLLYEFGVVFRAGRQAGLAELRTRTAELEACVPGLLYEALQDLLSRIATLDDEIAGLEKRLGTVARNDATCQALAGIPGIGTLTATALGATIGDAKAFHSGRELAAFLGLVPAQQGTGGKVRLGGISKRGDPYVRTLLIHGARAALFFAKDPGAWSTALRARRPVNVVIVAKANKMARTAWAILAHGRTYQKDYVSVKPAA